MPRLIPPELGNGKRPSDPAFAPATPAGQPGPNLEIAVPILDISEDTHALVGAVHDAALDPDDDTQLLTGALVYFDNQRPRNPRAIIPPGTPAWTRFSAGASTLHEAATEVITCVSEHALDMPQWIASTNDDLARVLAEHFTVDGYSTCDVVAMSEVPS